MSGGHAKQTTPSPCSDETLGVAGTESTNPGRHVHCELPGPEVDTSAGHAVLEALAQKKPGSHRRHKCNSTMFSSLPLRLEWLKTPFSHSYAYKTALGSFMYVCVITHDH